MPKCPWSGWKWQRGITEIASPFACCTVNLECSWKKTKIQKNSLKKSDWSWCGFKYSRDVQVKRENVWPTCSPILQYSFFFNRKVILKNLDNYCYTNSTSYFSCVRKFQFSNVAEFSNTIWVLHYEHFISHEKNLKHQLYQLMDFTTQNVTYNYAGLPKMRKAKDVLNVTVAVFISIMSSKLCNQRRSQTSKSIVCTNPLYCNPFFYLFFRKKRHLRCLIGFWIRFCVTTSSIGMLYSFNDKLLF